MAKLKNNSINANDIAEFADSTSDFGFELKILAKLNSMGIECEHGGTYNDPHTSKPRQFDIRAKFYSQPNDVDFTCIVRLAIECKNLRSNFPLVVFEMPRSKLESYHNLIYSKYCLRPMIDMDNGQCLKLVNDDCIYPPSEPVGKSCQQVGQTTSDELIGNDAEVYDKWSQAINSAHELLDRAEDDWKKCKKNNASLTLVLPVLVVPNNLLWKIKYETNGDRDGNPNLTERSSLYVDKYIPSSNRLSGISSSLSHIEFVTENGLVELSQSLLNGEMANKAFSLKGIKSAFVSED